MAHNILDDSIPVVDDIMVLPTGPEILKFSSSMQQDLYENILSHLLTEVESIVHAQVKQEMSNISGVIADAVATHVRTNVEASLRDTVTRALAEETAKLNEPREAAENSN